MSGRRALIVVDMQKDFFEGGSLPVPDAEQIVPNVTRLVGAFDLVFVTKDWHPEESTHFDRYPKHCVQYTEGAKLHEDVLEAAIKAHGISMLKGTWDDEDGFSAFDAKSAVHGLGLTELLEVLSVDTLYICGLATDYCVLATVRGAVAREYEHITVVTDAVAALGDREEALKVLSDFDGVTFATSDEVLE